MTARTTNVRMDARDAGKLVKEARERIYADGYVVNSAQVEDLLQPHSLVPTVVCATGISMVCRSADVHT